MFIKELTTMDGVSGKEEKIREYIIDKIKKYADEILIDPMGNLIVKRKGKGKPKIFTAHMDEVGFMITEINSDGSLSFVNVGGILPEVTIGSYVRNGDIKGVIGIKPVHLREKRGVVPKIKDLVIDAGFSSKEDAERKVKIGDRFVFDSEFRWISKKRYMTKAIDDRVGCSLIMDLFADKKHFRKSIIGVFTVQEEVGLRGAYGLRDILDGGEVYIMEGTGCGDFPIIGTDEKDIPSYPSLGKGPVITIMDATFIIEEKHLRKLEKICKDNKIPYQYKRPGVGGTDAGALQSSKKGMVCAVIAVPARYIHSANQIGDIDDYENTYKLMSKIVEM